MKKLISLCIPVFLILSCSSYRIVELESFKTSPGPDSKTIRTFAVTKNNMVIPELSVDRRGAYPTSMEEAAARLAERKNELEAVIHQKYLIPNSFWYQSRRTFFTTGFVLVSPIAIPVIYLSHLIAPPKDPEGNRIKSHIIRDYFKNIALEPIPAKPILRDELLLA